MTVRFKFEHVVTWFIVGVIVGLVIGTHLLKVITL